MSVKSFMKKKISIIGFGYNVNKNIIPALKNSKNLEIDKIYVKKKRQNNTNFAKYEFQSIDSLKNIKKHSWFYVSTPISSHYAIVKKLINLKVNVICEKPLTDSVHKTKTLLNLLKNKHQLSLIEVQMYKFHKLYDYFKKFIKKNKKKISEVNLTFRIPKVNSQNSIYSKKKSGGALLSLGFYPVTTAIDIFGYPKNIKSNLKFCKKKNIDIEGSFALKYSKIICNGYWGLGLNYENKAQVIFKDKTSFVFNMFYAKNKDVKCTVDKINKKNKITKTFQVGKDNQFLNMITTCVYDKKRKYNINDKNVQTIMLLKTIQKNL